MQLPLLPALPVLPPLPALPPLPVFPQFSPWYPLDRAPWEAGFYEVRDCEGVIYTDRPYWTGGRMKAAATIVRRINGKLTESISDMPDIRVEGHWLHMPANAVAWRGLARPSE